ncbi:HD-GYP domain-containing protein [Endothiovibrio diazotrophicus]
MIKKIRTDQLRLGMYVSDLNCGWLDHPFLVNHFKVDRREVIDKIRRHGIRELYIDTAHGLDVAEGVPREQVREEIDASLQAIAREQQPAQPLTAVGYDEELAAAHRVKEQALDITHSLLEDARLGRQIELEQADHMVEAMADSVFRNQEALVSLLRVKQADEYTFLHSVSVCVLMISFAKSLRMGRDVIHDIAVGALLHDVGKMRIENEVLNKPARLTDEEFARMKSHVSLGEEILAASPGLAEVSRQVAAEHHERFDGTGYPRGLKGEEISLYGQMAAIVDVYDAITSDRVYHRGMQPTDALRKLFEWSQFHFNRKLVHNFIHCVGIYPTGTLVRLESGRLAVVVEQRDGDALHPRVRVVVDTAGRGRATPYDIDLGDEDEKVVDTESPEKWNIDPMHFLSPPELPEAR